MEVGKLYNYMGYEYGEDKKDVKLRLRDGLTDEFLETSYPIYLVDTLQQVYTTQKFSPKVFEPEMGTIVKIVSNEPFYVLECEHLVRPYLSNIEKYNSEALRMQTILRLCGLSADSMSANLIWNILYTNRNETSKPLHKWSRLDYILELARVVAEIANGSIVCLGSLGVGKLVLEFVFGVEISEFVSAIGGSDYDVMVEDGTNTDGNVIQYKQLVLYKGDKPVKDVMNSYLRESEGRTEILDLDKFWTEPFEYDVFIDQTEFSMEDEEELEDYTSYSPEEDTENTEVFETEHESSARWKSPKEMVVVENEFKCSFVDYQSRGFVMCSLLPCKTTDKELEFADEIDDNDAVWSFQVDYLQEYSDVFLSYDMAEYNSKKNVLIELTIKQFYDEKREASSLVGKWRAGLSIDKETGKVEMISAFPMVMSSNNCLSSVFKFSEQDGYLVWERL